MKKRHSALYIVHDYLLVATSNFKYNILYTYFVPAVPEPSIDIAQSGPRSFSGLDYSLTCTVTVASGVSSSLVRVNWDRQDLTSPSSSISNTSISGLQYTRIITFSPLLRDDGGQYTCSVSVDGFSEADNSNSTMIVVNDRK